MAEEFHRIVGAPYPLGALVIAGQTIETLTDPITYVPFGVVFSRGCRIFKVVGLMDDALRIGDDGLRLADDVVGVSRRRILYERSGRYTDWSPQGNVEGWWYRPKTVRTRSVELLAGEGATNPFGDVWFSARGSARSQLEALYHERVHQLFSPRFVVGRDVRVRIGQAAYDRFATVRYLEEALAETVGRTRTVTLARAAGVRPSLRQIVSDVSKGVVFPFTNDYVTLRQLQLM